MVVSFECTSNGIRRLGEWPDMRAASAALPQGAYTTFRTYGGNRVLRLARHAERLRESIALLGRPSNLAAETVRAGVAGSLRETRYAESRFRLTLAASDDRLYVSIEPFAPYPAALYEQGVACVTVAEHRDNPHAKSTAFIASAGEAYRALPAGAHEGLMIGPGGAILEGLSSNFFAVLDGALRTEQGRALVGVTQALVLELARALLPGMPVVAEAARLDDLPRVSECFITSVSREVLPVARIDGRPVGDGQPGPVTRRLLQAYRDLVAREALAVE
jgi:branched-chain amino acid aminotransferase